MDKAAKRNTAIGIGLGLVLSSAVLASILVPTLLGQNSVPGNAEIESDKYGRNSFPTLFSKTLEKAGLASETKTSFASLSLTFKDDVTLDSGLISFCLLKDSIKYECQFRKDSGHNAMIIFVGPASKELTDIYDNTGAFVATRMLSVISAPLYAYKKTEYVFTETALSIQPSPTSCLYDENGLTQITSAQNGYFNHIVRTVYEDSDKKTSSDFYYSITV